MREADVHMVTNPVALHTEDGEGNTDKLSVLTDDDRQLPLLLLLVSQTKALLIKNTTILTRNWRATVAMLVVPVAFLVYLRCFIRRNRTLTGVLHFCSCGDGQFAWQHCRSAAVIWRVTCDED